MLLCSLKSVSDMHLVFLRWLIYFKRKHCLKKSGEKVRKKTHLRMEQPVNIRSLTHQLVQCLEIKPIREPWSKHLQTTWQLNHHPASGACKECDRRSLVSVQNDLKMPSIYESGSKSCPPRCVLYSFDPMLGPLWLLFETLTVRLG